MLAYSRYSRRDSVSKYSLWRQHMQWYREEIYNCTVPTMCTACVGLCAYYVHSACRMQCLLCAQCIQGTVPTVCTVHVGYNIYCVHNACRVQCLLYVGVCACCRKNLVLCFLPSSSSQGSFSPFHSPLPPIQTAERVLIPMSSPQS